MITFILLFLLTIAYSLDNPVIIWGEYCPTNIKTINYLTPESIENYLGLWYDLAHSENLFQNKNFYCPTAFYSTNKNLPNNTISVLNSQTDNKSFERDSANGKAIYRAPGKFSVSFGGPSSFFDGGSKGNYWVIKADDSLKFQEFAYVYSCSNVVFGHMPLFWILAREKFYEDVSVQSRIDDVLKIYKQGGASNGAVNRVRSQFFENSMRYCPENENI